MAKSIPGEFVPCDVNLSSDPAIMRAGPMAELLFRRGNEHAKRTDRDGILYSIELPLIAHGIPKPAQCAAALVREHLWVAHDEHWEIRSFLKWNLSQDEQSAKREANRIGALKSNHKQGRHSEERSPDCPLCEVKP